MSLHFEPVSTTVARVGYRAGRARDVNLIRYAVYSDGVFVGHVANEMVTFEKSRPGKNYVDRRWQSPRWKFYEEDSVRCRVYFETRDRAVAELLAQVAA
jgi:hypothetical protein